MDEKLMEAARLLQSNCENDECNFMQVNCPFQSRSIYGFWTCNIEGRPSCWGLPEQDKEAVQDLMAFKARYKEE